MHGTYAYAQSAGPGPSTGLASENTHSPIQPSKICMQAPRMLPLERCNRSSHTHPYASAPIKTSSNIHNEPVLLYRCVTTMSLHQYIHSGESSRAHHTKNPVQGARWRCTSYRDALGCIHYHKTSGASTLPESRNLLEGGRSWGGQPPKPQTRFWTVLMVNIIYCK